MGKTLKKVLTSHHIMTSKFSSNLNQYHYELPLVLLPEVPRGLTAV